MKDFVNQDISETNQDEESDEEDKEDTSKQNSKRSATEQLTVPLPIPVTLPVISTPILDIPMKSEEVKNEIVIPSEVKEVPQTIVIEDKPTVRFGQFNALFDSDNPSDSDMIYEQKESEENEEVPALEILDESGTPLSENLDFEDLESSSEGISSTDYEEL